MITPIASGSWGSVYAGRRLPGGRGAESCGAGDIALKFLPASTLSPGQHGVLEEIIRREIAVARRWRHPNVLLVHDVLTVQDPTRAELHGAVVVVMERAAKSLRDLLANASPGQPLADADRILTDVARGLDHLHAARWVHGDLKPANVLITADGIAKLADFGLADQLDGTHAYLPRVGTADYQPPEWWTEHATPRGVPVRTTADQWAFGVTAHQVLTGGLYPFPGATSRARAFAALSYARGDEPLRLADALPDRWRAVVSACLAPTHALRAAHTGPSLTRLIETSPRAGAVAPTVQQVGGGAAGHGASTAPLPRVRRGVARGLPLVVMLLLTTAAGSAATETSAPSGGELRADAAIPAQYRPVIENAAESHTNPAVTPALVAAILATQSGFDPNARGVGIDGTAEYGIAGWTPRVYPGFAVDAVGDGQPDYRKPTDAIYALSNQLAWADAHLGRLPGDRALLLAAAYHTSVKHVTATSGRSPLIDPYVASVRRYLAEFTDPRHGRLPAGPR